MIGNLIFVLICVVVVALVVLVIVLHLKFNKQMRINKMIVNDFNRLNDIILSLSNKVSTIESVTCELAEVIEQSSKKKRGKK